MRSTVFRLLDPVFGHPRGLAGRVGAAMMSKLNAKTENYLVDQAKLGGDETVLVIGPGPGVGLRAVAEATPDGRVVGVEVKAGATVRSEDLAGLRHLAARAGSRFVAGFVLYTGQQTLPYGHGLRALPLDALWQLAP